MTEHIDVNGVVAKTEYHCPVCDTGFPDWEPAFECKHRCEWAAKLNQATGLQLLATEAAALEPFINSWEVSRAIRASATAEAPAAPPIPVGGGSLAPRVPDSLDDEVPF